MRPILPIIVLSQFLCTSLWFVGNSVINEISRDLNLDHNFMAHITSAIQFGFILGTLCFALFSISDRYSPSRVFFYSSILAALFNMGVCIEHSEAGSILTFRFFTGFFLAGIYPVGMKIASDYFDRGLGKSLGFLVGALVLGTAFPHLLRDLTMNLPWRNLIYGTSLLSFLGGLCILFFVPDGPYRKQGQKLQITAFAKGFKRSQFRSVVFGYFGHMWELYTFWAFIPIMLATFNTLHPQIQLNVPFWSFTIIASGGLACVMGGILSGRYGAKKIATWCLFFSCMCCLVSPYFIFHSSSFQLLLFLFFWGLVVIADSPLFSTLIAQHTPEESRGTVLTIVNCIGFSITIVSIQFVNALAHVIYPEFLYSLLAIGPLLGLLALISKEPKSHGGE